MASFQSKYELLEQIGKGHYGVVHKCMCKESQVEFAVKILLKAKANQKVIGEVLSEVAILKDMRHEHVMSLVDYFDDGESVYIVLELVAGGELFARICKVKHFSEKDAAKLAYFLCGAVAYMHAQGVIHRDLKPENLLLTDDSVSSMKVVDFGFAEKVGNENTLVKCCGTPLYIAPEVLLAGLYKTGPPYGLQADMWSVGIITYILICGYPPIRAKSQTEQFKKIVEGKYDFPEQKVWGNISEEAKDFCRRLLITDPATRMTAKEALSHPWMSSQRDEHLPQTIEGIKEFNAGRAWKRGVFGVEAVNRILYLQRCTMLRVKPNTAVEQVLTEATEDVTKLDLNNNYVGPKGLLAVLDMVKENTKLTTLTIGNNGANNAVVEKLCDVARNHPSLTEIDLSNNPISHLAGRMILHTLTMNQRIVRLRLEGTVLQPTVLTKIALQLKHNAAVQGVESQV